MKLYLDSADLESIKRCFQLYPLDGVTTNPIILSRAKRGDYENLLAEIRHCIGDKKEIFAENVFVAGDAQSGASLVVRAIASGRKIAASVDKYLSSK